MTSLIGRALQKEVKPMKFGETKSYWAVFVVFLILVCSSIGQTQKQQDCRNGRGGGNPSWFNPGKNCNYKQKPYHYYERSIYLNQEQRGCKGASRLWYRDRP